MALTVVGKSAGWQCKQKDAHLQGIYSILRLPDQAYIHAVPILWMCPCLHAHAILFPGPSGSAWRLPYKAGT